MIPVYLSIGSNIDREVNIRSGIVALESLFKEISCSPVYESDAFGFSGERFYNLVVLLKTELSVDAVQQHLREIEKRHGRVRGEKKFSARTLDIDLLLYGDLIRHDELISVPRDEIEHYPFVLRPLLDIDAQLVHPESGRVLAELWQEMAVSKGDSLWPVDFNWENHLEDHVTD